MMEKQRWCEEHGRWEATAFVRHVPYIGPSSDRHCGGGIEPFVLLPILIVILILLTQR